MDASAFYEPWEEELDSYEKVRSFIDRRDARWNLSGRVFAWRGCTNSTWPFHSSLYRRLLWSSPQRIPKEDVMFRKEGEILEAVQSWGLDGGERGRMPVMEQLATLQHYGAPTRLLDISFNPLIALWFAVENQKEQADFDGRLFVVDVTDRLISSMGGRKEWSTSLIDRPWDSQLDDNIDSNDWRTSVWAWKPPRFLGRIDNQHGGFLFGGVPAAVPFEGKNFQIPKTPAVGPMWKIDEVRKHSSLALRFHKAAPDAGGVGKTKQAAFTVRISAGAKEEIRDVLQERYDLNYRTIYGDFPGFATHADLGLPNEPPS